MRLLKMFLLSPLRRRGQEVQKIAGKIRHLRRDAFVDDPLLTTYCELLIP